MGQGLYINYNDGNPAMEITAGLRVPIFSNDLPVAWDVDTYAIGNYMAGSDLLVLPKDCLYMATRGTNLVPTIGMFTGYTQNGSNITLNTWWSDNWGRKRTFASSIWQIAPKSSGNSGLLISDSTDFTVLPMNGSLAYCCWSGTVTINGEWATPTINGLNRSQYIVFAKWDADGVTVEFDGNKIYVSVDRNGDNVSASVTMRIVIFAPNIYPNRATGLTFVNSSNQCTFSTEYRPFVYNGFTYTPNWSYQDIGNRMIMLGRYGYDSSTNGGWDWLKWAGLMMSGNSVRCSRGRVQSQWTDRYSVVGKRLTSLTIPCIDNMY